MENYDLIDDYLANRLNEQDRNAFERGMEGDPALKSEVEFQQQIVQGVKQARITELKTMLSNVTISTPYWTGGKVAASVITAGIIATGVYFYAFEDDQQISSNESTQEDKKVQPSGETNETLVPLTSEEKKQDSITTEQPREKLNTKKELKKTSPVTKPDLQIVDPSSELSQTEEKTELNNPSRTQIGPSKMEVAIATPDKKHTFHYQFVDGKLLLYGPFDKNLYEILEIHGDGHAVFLFYKENYFLLDEKQSEIAKLEAIRDGELLKKLRQYRGQ
jgi:hypothetical protein